MSGGDGLVSDRRAMRREGGSLLQHLIAALSR